MVRHSLRVASCVVFVLGCLPVERAAAQTPPLLAAGLSLMSDKGTAAGFAVNASRDLTSGNIGFGPVGDFSLHRDNGVTWTTFGGGVRLSGRPAASSVIPFGQFLIGASVISAADAETFLTFTFGGGLHVPIGERLNFLFQFDLVNARFEGGSETGKRTTFGISVPLGTR